MKRFRFSLDKMRSYAEQVLDDEKNTLAALKQVQFQIEDRIGRLEWSFRGISRQMRDDEAQGIPAAKLRGYDLQLTNIRNQQKELTIELEKVKKSADEQTARVVAASKEVSKLDKLEGKQFEQYQKEVAKAEEIFIDEFISSDSIRKAYL